MKKNSPMIRLETLEEYNKIDIDFSENVDRVHFKDVAVSEVNNIEFNECVFDKVDFTNSKGISFIDCIFNNCDLSNMDLVNGSLIRVEFHNCKMIGNSYVEATIQNGLFDNCNMDYSNFNNSNINDVKFIKTNLKELSFMEVRHIGLIFDECDLSNSDFYKTKLKDVDLTNSNISGIMIASNDLVGAYINSYQAIIVARGMGIIVKD